MINSHVSKIKMIDYNKFFTEEVLLVLALFFSTNASAWDCQSQNRNDSLYIEGPSNSIVTDYATGLIWRRCPLGYDIDGFVCKRDSGTVGYSWAAALAAAEHADFSGNSDWRLPNVKELASIIDYGCTDPAINYWVFRWSNYSSDIWTSTSVPSDATKAYGIVFDVYSTGNANIVGSLKTSTNNVLLVRDM